MITDNKQKQSSLLQWYNTRKRSTTIFINVGLIFLFTSFLPSFIFDFPNLMKYLLSGLQTTQQPTLDFTYFFYFTFVYLGVIFLTYMMELGEDEKYDNWTFVIFNLFMLFFFVIVSLFGFIFLVISGFQSLNL